MTSNEEVLRRMNNGRELLVNIKTKQKRFVGLAMRREEMKNLSLTEKFPGSGEKRRQREQHIDGIVRTLGCGRKAGQLLEITIERGMAVHCRQRLQQVSKY